MDDIDLQQVHGRLDSVENKVDTGLEKIKQSRYTTIIIGILVIVNDWIILKLF